MTDESMNAYELEDLRTGMRSRFEPLWDEQGEVRNDHWEIVEPLLYEAWRHYIEAFPYREADFPKSHQELFDDFGEYIQGGP